VGRRTHALLAAYALFCFCFLGWAQLATLDIVSLAAGEVIPSTRVKRIQHLEGGIVREILVREGDQVRRGQPLVTLERTMQGSSVEEIRVRIAGLEADEARLVAEAEGFETPRFPPGLERDFPDVVGSAVKLFEASRERLENEAAAKREEIVQLANDVDKTTASLTNNRKAYELIQKELAISESLLKDELTSELQHLRLQRAATKLRSSIQEDEAALGRARAALDEGRRNLEHVGNRFREQARDELMRTRRDLGEFRERLKKYADTLKRTTVRAPEGGVVKALYALAPGEVVKPGETIMILVPTQDLLVIEAHLPLQEVGFVHAGQGATIRLASPDARRYGELRGKVTAVSPDAFTDEQGRAYYTIRLATERAFFEKDGNRYDLYPGMTVLAYVHTGMRTVLEYILSPYFLDSPGHLGAS
jgi:adhesin transport system membrane fusion protein